MNYLSIDELSKHYGEKDLFDKISFGIDKGDKIALIARNGSGKSTLMRILSGADTQDSGTITFRKGITVGMLEQDPEFEGHLSIREFINSSHAEIMAVIRTYEKALEAQTNLHNPANQKAFEAASAKMEELHAWDYERRMIELLTLFGISDPDQRIDTLSGGQRKRMALALVLLDQPDLLLLDEPTNHLDISMIEWLEKFLTQSNITLLMVTHDRYFLDRICDQILELNDGQLYHHKGNYSYFLEKRAEREIVYQTEIDKAKKLMKREQEWIRRSPMARTTKSKARIDSFYETKEKAQSGKKEQEIQLDVKISRIGGKILELKNISKSYGDIPIVNSFDYVFKKGERIGLIGKNGVGKTSFLNLLTKAENVDSGEVATGETIVFGYYTQAGVQLKENMRVIDVVKEIAEVIPLDKGRSLSASQFLQHFMFSPEMQFQYVSSLSGGEKRRLYLLTVLIKNPNFLILDEPTNDLDLYVLSKLEDFLAAYKGCLILVSHDRYFLDNLVDELFVFEGEGRIKGFVGTYSEYHIREVRKEEQLRLSQAAAKKAEKEQLQSKAPKEKQKLTYKEQREYETLEKEIPLLEQEKTEIENFLNSGSDNFEELQKLTIRLSEVMALLDEKEMRWLELDEYVRR